MNQDSAPERQFADEAFQQSLQDLEILLEAPEQSPPPKNKPAIAPEEAVWEAAGEDLEEFLDASEQDEA